MKSNILIYFKYINLVRDVGYFYLQYEWNTVANSYLMPKYLAN